MESKPRCYSYLRFSTPDQKTGDSTRRQTEAAEKWASENGLILDEEFKLKDEGLSGYHQRNLDPEAALGGFLRACEAGEVPRGSILIVESLDRLSRAREMDALALFQKILGSGVKICILSQGGRVYSHENMDLGGLIMNIVEMSRSYEESKRKASRIHDVWTVKHKRAAEDKTPTTSRLPGWLTLNKKTGKIEIIPERAELVRRIFAMSAEGHGVHTIATTFNNEKIDPWGEKNSKAKYWHRTYIKKIFDNGAVYGLYRPTQMVDGERIDLPPIENYYPAVISKEEFDQNRLIVKSRNVGSGRTGGVTNLFGDALRCSECGATVYPNNKGARAGVFMTCTRRKSGAGCNASTVKYEPFEEAFLKYCQEIDLSTIIDTGDNELRDNQFKLELVTVKLSNAENEISNLIESLKIIKNPTAMQQVALQLDAMSETKDKLDIEKAGLETRIEILKQPGNRAKDHIENIRNLTQHLKESSEEERILLRKKLRAAIKSVVLKIIVFADGLSGNDCEIDGDGNVRLTPISDAPIFKEYPALWEAMGATYLAETTGKENACIIVSFKNGNRRIFKWDADRRMFRQQYSSTAEWIESYWPGLDKTIRTPVGKKWFDLTSLPEDDLKDLPVEYFEDADESDI